MPNCTYTDVRRIIDTELADADLTALIVLADQEITTRQMTGRAANILKMISMYLTASMVAMRDPYIRSIGDFRDQKLSGKDWRDLAHDLIRRTGPSPYVIANEPLPWE